MSNSHLIRKANGHLLRKTNGHLVNALSAPTITTTSLPAGSVGTAYSYQLAATGGITPYTWSVQGTLPAGLSLSAAGLLSGTPTAAGMFYFGNIVCTGANGAASMFYASIYIGTSNDIRFVLNWTHTLSLDFDLYVTDPAGYFYAAKEGTYQDGQYSPNTGFLDRDARWDAYQVVPPETVRWNNGNAPSGVYAFQIFLYIVPGSQDVLWPVTISVLRGSTTIWTQSLSMKWRYPNSYLWHFNSATNTVY